MNAHRPKHFLARKSYRKLARLAAAFIKSLRQEPEFAAAINADLRAFRADLVGAIRGQLQLRRGRRRDPRLDRACELLKHKSASQVLQAQIPNFQELDSYTRYLLEKGLRQAAARRKRRAKHAQNRQRKATTPKVHCNRASK